MLAPLPLAPAQDNTAARAARDWRQTHERQILADYFAFLKIPNVSHDLPNVRRNAEYLMQAMEKRGLKPRLLEVSGAPPAVYGEILVPGRHTLCVLFALRRPAARPQRMGTPPFEPTLRTARLDRGGQVLPFPAPGQRIEPD
jgi:hypothetical protein